MNQKSKEILRTCVTISCFQNLSEDKKSILNKEAEETIRLCDNNTFLGGDKKSRFLTFNLPKGLTCPESTKICAKRCYQGSVEKMLQGKGQDSAVVCFRKLNWYLSLKDDFIDKMSSEILKKRPKNGQDLFIRIHSSGDFYSIDYLEKWMKIALITKLKGKNYSFVAYTKSFEIMNELLQDQKRLRIAYGDAYKIVYGVAYEESADKSLGVISSKNLEINDFNINIIASVMDDTSTASKVLIKRWGLPTYTAIDTAIAKNAKGYVECGDIECANCLKCYEFPMEGVTTKLR